MPRNGSGTMTITNSFSSGSTISSSQVNANFTDVASEITGSLPRNGEAAMTGQMKAASGTAALPGITFSADTDCGFYRIGADNIGLAIGGTKILDISSTGVAITGQLTTTNGPIPSGTKMLFYADAAPTGWTIFTTSINDKALRVVSGSAAGGGTGGATGGTTAFTSVFTSRTLVAGNIPQLTTSSDGDHTHNYARYSTLPTAGTDNFVVSNLWQNSTSVETSPNGAHTHTVGSASPTALDFAVQYASVIICTKD